MPFASYVSNVFSFVNARLFILASYAFAQAQTISSPTNLVGLGARGGFCMSDGESWIPHSAAIPI